MAAIHGALGRVRITSSIATTSTDAAGTLSSVDDRTLTIANATQRHWEPGTTMPRVYGATTAVEIGAYAVNHVQGTIVFATDHSTAVAYKVDYAWFPTSCLGMCRSWSLDASVDMADTTVFSCSTATDIGWRTYTPGLAGATIKLGRLYGTSESSAPAFVDRQALGNPLYVELWNSTGGDRFECYARIQGDAWANPVDGLLTEEVTLQADGPVYWTTST